MSRWFRFEISGGHTGSSFLYYSYAGRSLAEVQREAEAFASDAQLATFLLVEAPTIRFERVEDGRPVWSWVGLGCARVEVAGGPRFELQDDGVPLLEGREPWPDRESFVSEFVDGPLLDRLQGEVRVTFDVRGGPPASIEMSGATSAEADDGELARFTREGVSLSQPWGWVGDFSEGWSFVEPKVEGSESAEPPLPEVTDPSFVSRILLVPPDQQIGCIEEALRRYAERAQDADYAAGLIDRLEQLRTRYGHNEIQWVDQLTRLIDEAQARGG